MRKLLKRLLENWVIKMGNKYSSRPDRKRIHRSLTALFKNLNDEPGKRGRIFNVKPGDKFIVFSDQHKGARNDADDFALVEPNYLKALAYYDEHQYHYINLGDCEELWKNQLESVIKHNKQVFEHEKRFVKRNAYTKIFGNHDLYWDNDPLSSFNLKRIYGQKVRIYEGAILQMTINGTPIHLFLTHGHQGDLKSDGNWFSKWFVSNIWAPLQSFLKINPNTPAYDNQLKTLHNKLMYSWVSAQKNILLITGHTHQPVFASLTHLERLYIKLRQSRKDNLKPLSYQLLADINKRINKGDKAPRFRKYNPFYFNSGCCCFNDGDMTGIEIDDGIIKMIKWSFKKSGLPERIVLEEAALKELILQGYS